MWKRKGRDVRVRLMHERKERARFEGKQATLRGRNEHEEVEVGTRGKAGPWSLQACVRPCV